MNFFQSAILGIVQGVTEFLPVSSTGHLAMASNLLGLEEPQLIFDTFLHLATLLAVIIFFAGDLLKLSKQKMLVIVVGTIPIALSGVFLKDLLEIFYPTFFVGIFLIITGFINYFSDKRLNTVYEDTKITYKKGFIIGIFQAIAVMPGISRSGITLFAALKQNINREEAFRFSFILSIPAILGAVALQGLTLNKTGIDGINPGFYAVGGLAAFFSALLSLKLLKYIVTSSKLEFFAYYCWIVGGLYLVSFFV